jgi:tryptophan synthase alpha chain
MMNRLEKLFIEKPKDILNIYFTAGFPGLKDTMPLLKAIEKAGADIAEIGIPFSDPVADGETIQKANTRALENGMTVELLFTQLKEMREEVRIPVILMGDVNPLIQYGLELFCQKCHEVGIDGLILPNLPMDEYLLEFKPVFDKYGLFNIFLITPQTSEERIRRIDENSAGFIYMVSSASTTGSTSGITGEMRHYFDRVNQMDLKNPRLIGFGIKDQSTFSEACQFANGAIIGSAFIREIQESLDPAKAGAEFIRSILT